MKSRATQQKPQAETAAIPNYIEVDTAAHPRPMRALLLHLNQPEPSAFGRQRIARHADTSMRVIQLGLGAIGHLLARSAVEVEEGTIPADCMESLGTLMAELSDMASVCYQLASEGRTAAVVSGEQRPAE